MKILTWMLIILVLCTILVLKDSNNINQTENITKKSNSTLSDTELLFIIDSIDNK